MVPNKRRKVVSVQVTDVEKRRYPSKHYVYIIQVTWDDNSNTVIYRRYSKFFDFQIALLESFPNEGGLRDPSKRIIPFLPGKILFGRSHVREVAMKRLKPIDEYCSSLIQLPLHIANSNQVLDFFESKPEDLNPTREEESRRKKKEDQDISEISGPIVLEQYCAISDFTRSQPKELTISAGQVVEVIEKHENGWWFVNDEEGERGWVPGVYLEKTDGQAENLVTTQSEVGQGEKYITTSQFTGGNDDEVSFGVGVLVEVLQKNLEGWWLVSYQNKQGWAPASYLEKPAEAVLRQNSNRRLSSLTKSPLENRRSFPGDGSALRLSSAAVSSLSAAADKPRSSLKLAKTKSNPSFASFEEVKDAIATPLTSQLRPPPKRSTIQRGSGVSKPQKPPPLPPAPKIASEPVYDYFTTASFAGDDIPHGITFEQDKKVKVLEKAHGDWWFIELGGQEGWAPASHVKRVYRQEKAIKASERPKPPGSKKPTLPIKPLQSASAVKSSLKSNECASNRGQVDRPALSKRERPIAAPADKKSPPPKPPVPKPVSKPIQSTLNKSATKVAKGALKSAIAPAVKTRNEAPTPPSKPTSPNTKLIGSKPRLKSTSPDPKPFPNKNNPTSPVASSWQKPTVGKKNPPVKNRFFGEGTNGGETDFRSVLKTSSNSNGGRKNEPTNGQGRAGPAKPAVPTKPNKKPLTRPGFVDNPSTAVKPKSKVVPAKPPVASSKPVLRRLQKGAFQNHNANNNGPIDQPTKANVVVVNRVTIEQTPPNLFAKSRGVPDGQVDEASTKEANSLSINAKEAEDSLDDYVAIADFAPENPTELAFAVGDRAKLLENLENSWWYVEIGGRLGWVPCTYFEKRSTCSEKPADSSSIAGEDEALSADRDSPKSDEVVDDEPLYSEIYESSVELLANAAQADLYRVVRHFSADEPSMISAAEGDLVGVLERSSTGWYFVKVVESKTQFVNHEGWLPVDHLERV